MLLWLAISVIRSTRAFARNEGGQGLVEYALILGLVAIGVIVALSFLSGGVGNAFEMVTDNLEAAATQQDVLDVAQHHGHGWCRHHGC